jgi:antitoxin MazE
MIVSVVSIGNSRGIRIPKSIINEFNIEDKIELQIREDELVLKPISKKPRLGWEKAFKKMNENLDDKLIISDTLEDDVFDWDWEQ